MQDHVLTMFTWEFFSNGIKMTIIDRGLGSNRYLDGHPVQMKGRIDGTYIDLCIFFFFTKRLGIIFHWEIGLGNNFLRDIGVGAPWCEFFGQLCIQSGKYYVGG